MRPAGGFQDWPGFPALGVKSVMPRVGVGLQDARPAGENPARMFAATGRRIVEQNRRRFLAAERPVIADIGPKPAGARLDLGQRRRGGVVHMEAFGRERMPADFR